MYYNRFDIVDAYYWWYVHHHNGQSSPEYARLCRIQKYYKPSSLHKGPSDENARAIYDNLCDRVNCTHPRLSNFDYEIIDHGVQYSQYFQGCSTMFSNFDHVVTGYGDTYNDALDDALEFMCEEDQLFPSTEYLNQCIDKIEENERLGNEFNSAWNATHEYHIDVSNTVTPSQYKDCLHVKSPGVDFCKTCHDATVEAIIDSCDDFPSYVISIRFNI